VRLAAPWLIVLLFGPDEGRRAVPLGLDLYRPLPEANPPTSEKVSLGRRLFFDKRLSLDRSVACASCHQPRRAFTDGRKVAVGFDGRVGTRNVPTLVNRVYGKSFFLDGRATTLEQQALEPILNPREMNLARSEIKPRTGLEPEMLAMALASYVRTIVSGNSRYDRYVSGDTKALSAQALFGLGLFRGKAHCTVCHAGPNLTDDSFHNTGVAWRDGELRDPGRFKVTGKIEDRGSFKVPTLREVARTAPYMHDGSLATLEAVVDYYNRGGNPNPGVDEDLRPLHLTAEEKRALVEFLKSLSGKILEGTF
jgi:cytochrome c peroxidase